MKSWKYSKIFCNWLQYLFVFQNLCITCIWCNSFSYLRHFKSKLEISLQIGNKTTTIFVRTHRLGILWYCQVKTCCFLKNNTLIEFTLIDIPPGIWFSWKIKIYSKECLEWYGQSSINKIWNTHLLMLRYLAITAIPTVFWYITCYNITDLTPYSTIVQFPWGHILYIILFLKPYFFLGVVYIYSRKSNTDLYNLSSSNIGKRIHSVSNTKWKKINIFQFL